MAADEIAQAVFTALLVFLVAAAVGIPQFLIGVIRVMRRG